MSSQPSTLSKLFVDKRFRVPGYQRSFSWTSVQVQDLLEDIGEAINEEVPHYLGPFVLCRSEGQEYFDVVDGQQRLTTVVLLVSALVDRLEDDVERALLSDRYLREHRSGLLRLELAGTDGEFLSQLLSRSSDAVPTPASFAQRRLLGALRLAQSRLAVLSQDEIRKWLKKLTEAEVLEFVKTNPSEVIRIFETVNDRGKPLSTVDKVKSHLVYYSNRHLKGELDQWISDAFGDIFRSFDAAKDSAVSDTSPVDLVVRESFTEDAILRYHFLAFPSKEHNPKINTEQVLSLFLKKALRAAKGDNQLKVLIKEYVADLRAFFQAFEFLLAKARKVPAYWKLFVVLEPNSRYYPLLLRLACRQLLDAPLPSTPDKTFLDLVTATVFREDKVLGARSERELANLARDAYDAGLGAEEIERRLREFCRAAMTDAGMQERLRLATSSVTYLRYLFLEYCESLRPSHGQGAFTLNELEELWRHGPTIEHILPRERVSQGASDGFASNDEYAEGVEAIGNLSLIERTINSSAQHKPPAAKAQDPKLYQASRFTDVKAIAARLSTMGDVWNKKAIAARTVTLYKFAMSRWHC